MQDKAQAPVSDCIGVDVVTAVDTICQSYDAGCVKFTGQADEVENDRRHQTRAALEIPFYLHVVGTRDDGTRFLESAEPVLAVTRDLSHRGIGWRTDVPIQANCVLAEFDIVGAGSLCLLVEVLWQDGKSSHRYLAGGQLLSVFSLDDLRGK